MDVTLAEIAAVTGGALHGGPADALATSFAFDSRALEANACFVALRGARDGHDFVGDAFERGAIAALVARMPADSPGALILVPDPLAALADLGRWARTRLAGATVVAITGSAGKTATKDLTAAALSSSLAVHASVGSFNNEFGLPLTLLAAPMATEVVVAEMGARFAGNIADLCGIARPDVGIVTHVGLAHAEHLGGRAGITQVKGELLEALPAAGVAVVNADDDATPELVSRTRARVLRVGARSADVDVATSEVHLDAELRPRFVVESPWGTTTVQLAVRGAHQVQNAAMAAAAALSLGVSLADVAKGLAEATTANWRMQLHLSPEGVTVLNDAYNASPTSVAAALESFAHLAPGGRRIFVFGEMLELGDQGVVEHTRVGEIAADTGVDVLVIVGAGARPAAIAARERGLTVVDAPDASAALDAVRGMARPGDAVLVKASRAIGLEVVADALVAGESKVS